MNISFPYNVAIKFPGDLEYIPSVRKFVSEMLKVSSFSEKFAYRSEIIVDEICNNAVNYGCKTDDAYVELHCEIFEDKIEFVIKDQGGKSEHLKRLQSTINESGKEKDSHNGLGLEIVRMLSESVNVSVENDKLTSVRVVRKREA